MRAAYDEIADWYEDYVSDTASEFSGRVTDVLGRLLAPGSGPLLDLCCGTGIYSGVLRELGYSPVGIDLSMGQLRHATRRLPVAVGDASALPVASGSVDAATCLLAHTDLPDYAAVLREAARVLRPGGRFVHVGIHPCFCGPFADRTDPARIIVDSSYERRDRRYDLAQSSGVRIRVGAWHTPLDALLRAALDAGLTLTGIEEIGPPGGVPDILALGFRRLG